jgi:integrase/recombinase XerC/integrase/recombinase XerD
MGTPRLPANQLTRGALSGHLTSFLESIGDGRTQTRATYAYALGVFLRWFEADARCFFAVDDIYRYKHYLKKEKQLSDATVATYLNALRRFCGFLSVNGTIGFNPAATVRHRTDRSRQDTRTLSSADVERLLGVAGEEPGRGQRDRILIKLLIEYGFREMEIVRLNLGDYVVMGGSAALVPEGEKEKAVALSPEIMHLLNAYIAARRDQRRDDPLFLSDGNRTRGMRMTTRGIRSRIEKHFAAAGIGKAGSRKITPHILRRTGAALLAHAGTPQDEIRYRMRIGTLATARKFISRNSQ